MTGSRSQPEKLTRDNALLLHVDHQEGLYTGVRDISTLELKHNVVGLTKAMLALQIPVVFTTTTESMWGPLIPELMPLLGNRESSSERLLVRGMNLALSKLSGPRGVNI